MAQLDKRIMASIFAFSLLVVGGCATVPEEEGMMEEPTPVVTDEGLSYTVVRGDHLWGISASPRIYGNPYQWPLIYKANTDKIEDADLIYPGQILAIDDNPSSSEIDAAVRHARSRGAWSVGVVEESDRAYLAR